MGKGVPFRRKFKGDSSEKYVLVLYNDSVNTFNHVIRSLIEVCGHNEYQAEQCAMLVHFKGKYEIKSGSPAVLEAMSEELCRKGLKTEVLKASVA